MESLFTQLRVSFFSMILITVNACAMHDVSNIKFDAYQNIGAREVQQDAYSLTINKDTNIAVFAICDGHNVDMSAMGLPDLNAGKVIADLASKKLVEIVKDNWPTGATEDVKKDFLIRMFLAIDEVLCHDEAVRDYAYLGGTTALVAVIDDGVVYVANAGDCRAILASGDGVIPLSNDHKVCFEFKRILDFPGGEIIANDYSSDEIRLRSGLNVSRSLGDSYSKKFGSIATPEVTVHRLLGKEKYLVMGCDGLFDRAKYAIEHDGVVAGMVEKNVRALIATRYDDASCYDVWLQRQLLKDFLPNQAERVLCRLDSSKSAAALFFRRVCELQKMKIAQGKANEEVAFLVENHVETKGSIDAIGEALYKMAGLSSFQDKPCILEMLQQRFAKDDDNITTLVLDLRGYTFGC